MGLWGVARGFFLIAARGGIRFGFPRIKFCIPGAERVVDGVSHMS